MAKTAHIIARNDYHGTTVQLRVTGNRITKRRANQLGRELCTSDCICGRTRFFDREGHQMLADSEPDGSLVLISIDPTDHLADI
jgi:hypothetical protein